MPKFYAHLSPAAPAKSQEYMTQLFYQLRTGVAGCAEFNKFDLSLIRSWIMQGWAMETEVVIDEAQHASVRAYTHLFYENDLLDVLARSECLAGTQGATTWLELPEHTEDFLAQQQAIFEEYSAEQTRKAHAMLAEGVFDAN